MPDPLRDLRRAEPAVFWWFDDALAEANRRAALTRRRFRVKAHAGMWRISPSPHGFSRAVFVSRSEVCS